MQKVSKQSLAMLALSILLAISIALTFTFAGLSDKKTATGTISFQGNVALIVDSTTNIADSVSNNNYTIVCTSVTDTDTLNAALATASFKLAANSQAAYLGVQVVITSETAGNIAALKMATGGEADWTFADKTGGTYTMVSTNKIAAKDSTTALSDLFDATLDLTVLVPNAEGTIDDIVMTFTIKADATAQVTDFAA